MTGLVLTSQEVSDVRANGCILDCESKIHIQFHIHIQSKIHIAFSRSVVSRSTLSRSTHAQTDRLTESVASIQPSLT